MKRAIKYFAAVLAAALLCLALVACGEKAGNESAGKKYNFKETTISSAGGDAAVSAYNTAYKGSTLEVKDGEVIWTIADTEYKMTYTMDGDTYVLGGDFTKQLGQALEQAGTGSIVYYGQETEEGFAILMVQTLTGSYDVTYTFHFTAA